MDAFFQRHRQLLLSSLYLVFGIVLAGYVGAYQHLKLASSDLRIASARLKAENTELNKLAGNTELAGVEKEEKISSGIRSIPTFLSHINNVSRSNNVVIRKFTPDTNNTIKYQLEIIVDFPTFIRFAADLESLDTVIQELQVRPYDQLAVPPTHFITFSIIPRNDAIPLADKDERLKTLRERVLKNPRNPFQRLDKSEDRTLVDLTWVYKLTSIGTDAGKRYATIDRKDYSSGDTIEGTKRVITAIERREVFLSEDLTFGKQPYVMRFRTKGD